MKKVVLVSLAFCAFLFSNAQEKSGSSKLTKNGLFIDTFVGTATTDFSSAGIGGGLLSYIMMLLSGNYAVSGGASGAVFGVIGGLLWVVIYHRGKLEGMTTKGILIMIVLSLYFGFTSIGVDNWCHVGGMLCGFLATSSISTPGSIFSPISASQSSCRLEVDANDLREKTESISEKSLSAL